MKRFGFPACLIATLAIFIHGAAGQINAPVVQNAGAVAKTGGAQASNARPNGAVSRNFGRGAVGAGPRTAYSRTNPRVAQPAVNLPPNYSQSVQRPNPSRAAMSDRQSGRAYNVQPSAELLAENNVGQTALPLTNAQRIPRPDDLQPTRNIPGREDIARSDPAIRGTQTGKIFQPPSDEPLRERQQSKPGHNWQEKKHRLDYSDAARRHRHEWHDRNWWKRNCDTIVFVNSAYYFLDAGYWYPAWGYDPLYSYYDYDGPIYTYGDLLPDQVIANVQGALQEAGYYFGPITGSLSVETRAALANFQRDYGLIITGAIDEPTVEALGLY